jgi:uncharacterized integral membrane protein (TIGR00698 family)
LTTSLGIGRKKPMPSYYVHGLLLMSAVAFYSLLLSKVVTVGGKHPIEAVLVAIIIGMLVRQRRWVPAVCEPGLKLSDQLLAAGIVLMGVELDLATLLAKGAPLLIVIVVTMATGIAAIYALGRLFQLPRALAVLLSVGTTICGGTAIAMVAPILRAPEDETSYAIGTISLWGLAALLIYPLVARELGIDDVIFGVFAGTAIHSTPQVVGAGYIYSEVAGNTATTVKLIRNCFIAPVVATIAMSESQRRPEPRSAVSLRKAFPWFLFGFFILAGLATLGLLSPKVVATLGKTGRELLLIGMAGVGLNTRLGSLRVIGYKPLVVGLLGSLLVALVSAGMISSLLL